MLFRVQVFQRPRFSGSRFFRVQVFYGPGFSGFRLFKVWVQGPGPGFRSCQEKQIYVTTKKLSEDTEQNRNEPHSLAVLFKVYLQGAINHIQVAMRNTQWMFMGGYLHYIYVFVCGHCLAKTYCFLPSIGQLAMPNFFCQIYVCNVTNKRIKKKLEENLYVCTLKLDLPLPGSVI